MSASRTASQFCQSWNQPWGDFAPPRKMNAAGQLSASTASLVVSQTVKALRSVGDRRPYCLLSQATGVVRSSAVASATAVIGSDFLADLAWGLAAPVLED